MLERFSLLQVNRPLIWFIWVNNLIVWRVYGSLFGCFLYQKGITKVLKVAKEWVLSFEGLVAEYFQLVG